MSSSSIARKGRHKKQTRLTFDPISAEEPSGSPTKSQGPSPAKIRYEKTNGGASASSGGRVTRSGMSSGSPLKESSSIKGKFGKKARDGKISFGSLPTPAKSSQKDDDTIVDSGVASGSRRSTRGSQKAKPIIEEPTDSEDKSTIEVEEAKAPSRKNKKESAATETTDDELDVEITSSERRGSGSGPSRGRSFTGRGFIQGGSTYNAPLPSSGNRGRAPKALVHSPKPPTPSKSTPKKRSVTLSDTSDDDVFTSKSKPKSSQRPGLFSQRLAVPIPSSDESCEEAKNDSEDDILPSSTRRRQATRTAPPITLEGDSDDPDDEPPTSPMKRKRPAIISDDEDSDIGSPVKKTKVLNGSNSDDDLPPMTKLSKPTPPESDSPAPSPQANRKRSPKKHRTAKQKQLEILKRKRAGESNPVLTDSESEDEAGGLYDSDSDALTTFEDEEDENVEEEVQDTRKRKSPKKPIRENEDEYDSDFVDDDDDGLIGVPDYGMIPLQFTAAAHKPLKEHFKEAVEWCVQNKINPGFNQNLMPIYKSAWNKLEDAYSGLSGSKFVSTSWTRDFTKGLYARPDFSSRRLAPGEAIDILSEVKCEACNRRKHIPTWGISLRGSAYYKESLAEVEKDDSSSEEDKEEEDSDDEKDTRSLNSRDEPLPPQDKEYMVGAVCKENAEHAHTLIHLKYALNQWVIGSLESKGHLTIAKLAQRDKMSAKKRQKEVNGIVDQWKEEKEIKELYRIWKQQLETAQNASTTGSRY
ncbi:hypothetical protein SBOR_3554 [Sclerotinia borealis F-4128]|uniref:DUF4211 domain-containing protein n=1 Tax=Sclerotinia borealis (strain F-4128) TaxID=1432307 RepID=W9CH59_SCLBF|nr:hypothetical protein SBOR_3554 [Sclerotinia borealis F-4128]